MKRLFSLLLLLWCSLTFCGAASAQQTWRIDTYSAGYNQSHPQIAIDDSGRVWVAWLSDMMGNYDVYCSFFEYGYWQDEIQIVGDGVDQHCVRMIKDKHNGWIYAAWDSAGQVQVANYTSGWSKTDVADAAYQLSDEKCFSIGKDTLGNLQVAWSSPVNTGYGYQVQGNLRTYNGSSWDTTEIILPAYTTSDEDAYFVKQVVCRIGERPYILTSHEWDGLVYWNYGGDILFTHWQGDSVWANTWVDSWHDVPSVPIGIALAGVDTILVSYCDNFGTDSSTIVCRRYIDNAFTQDTTFIIAAQQQFHSGAICSSPKPCIAWSDSHSIFLNTYYDAIWSHPPVQISDPELTNCINPDIVAENDSTVWVCYQNDGDIYVTRTSVPLGISEKPTTQIPNPKSKIALSAWPNPASNVIHFSYTLPNLRNSSVAIYDIAGRLVRNIEVKNDQIHWNCADNAGRKVASGVYFARLRSDGQETIRKISVIR